MVEKKSHKIKSSLGKGTLKMILKELGHFGGDLE